MTMVQKLATKTTKTAFTTSLRIARQLSLHSIFSMFFNLAQNFPFCTIPNLQPGFRVFCPKNKKGKQWPLGGWEKGSKRPAWGMAKKHGPEKCLASGNLL
jgi:hypothetical protein